MKNGLVSIVMPSYNSSCYIADAIYSVMKQTYISWELLITDDASTDDTVNMVETFIEQDSRIRLFRLEKNSGVATARNFSIQHAKGQFIAFLDSDDVWHPEKLEKQLRFMKEHQYSFTFTAYQLMSHNGEMLDKIINTPESIDYKHYLKNTIIGCLTVMLDREQLGNFLFPNLKTSQDMALWLTILRNGNRAYGLNEVLADYRLSPQSNSGNKRKAAQGVWTVYRKQEKLSWLFSFYNFIGYAWHAVKKRL